MTIFSILKEIITEKQGDYHLREEFESKFNPYMILRYLSMKPEFLTISAIANSMYQNISKEQLYLFLVKSVPYNRSSYIVYIKAAKNDDEK